MGWIGCVGCKKLQRDFVSRTFALIVPVQYVLQQVSFSYGTIQNAPRFYEALRNISLGSNGVDWVRSLQKIQTWHRGMDFCINEMIPNAPKYYKTDRNNSLGSNGVDGVCWLRKITMRLRGTNFCINCTSSVCFATSFMQTKRSQMHRNTTKWTQTLV